MSYATIKVFRWSCPHRQYFCTNCALSFKVNFSREKRRLIRCPFCGRRIRESTRKKRKIS